MISVSLKGVSYAIARLRLALIRARQEGIVWTIRETLHRFVIAVTGLLLLPLDLTLFVAGFRRLPVITQRLGHLATEIDCFLKEQALGRLPTRRWFVIALEAQVANAYLLEYWRKRIAVVSNPLAAKLLGLCTRRVAVFQPVRKYVLALHGAAKYYEVNATWNQRPALLALTPEDVAHSQDALHRLGVPENTWFVCIHAREPGYFTSDDAIQSYRNSNIHDLVPAIREIHRRGGWCVRMGHPSGAPLTGVEGCIDYAHHPLRSDWLDVLLCASCRFFLGSTSGIHLVSAVFGVPCALANVTPISGIAFRPGDLAIPKLLWSKKKSRWLTFVEALRSPAASYRTSRQFEQAGLELRDSSPGDILDLTIEMLDCLQGEQGRYAPYAVLQERFQSLISTDHYCFGAASRIGSLFLRKYIDLLHSEGSDEPVLGADPSRSSLC